MKKFAIPKLAASLTIASTAVLSLSAQAATATGPFTVTVAFTPSCTVTVAPRTIAFTYTAFAAAVGPVNVSAPVALTCSRGIGATATAAYGETGAANGLIGATNLRYTLSVPVKTNAPGTAATGISPTNIGSPDNVSFTFSGSLPQQAGAGPNSTLINANDLRSLVVTF